MMYCGCFTHNAPILFTALQTYRVTYAGCYIRQSYKARCVRLGTHDRMAKEARVGRRGLGGVPVMRAARGWASVVDRTAVAAALFGDVSPVRSQRDVGTRDRADRLGKRCSGSFPIGPVARGEGVGTGYGVLPGLARWGRSVTGQESFTVEISWVGSWGRSRDRISGSRSYLGVEI